MIRNEASLITAALEVGLFTDASVNKLRQQARKERRSLIEVLMFHHRFPLMAFYQSLAKQYGLPYFSPESLKMNRDLFEKIGINLMLRKNFFVIEQVANEITKRFVVLSEPNDRVLVDIVQRLLGGEVSLALSEPDAIRYALETLPWVEEIDKKAEFDSVFVFDELMKQAYYRQASDIHLEPNRYFCQVRMRVDGMMQTLALRMNKQDTEAVVNRIKVLSNMDISEQRMPQDGGLSYQVLDWDIPANDIRVASIPTKWGERITMRILGDAGSALTLDKLDMPAGILDRLKKVLKMPHGMFLVTGPTGSGKSTTLYASIRAMDSSKINVLTAEDPIEQNLPDITQVQVGGKVNFSSALRSFLRHDPDVILVGEVRDLDTAETALKAAMTGHLVLSTLHTNNAASAIARLVNLGCDRFLVGTTVVGVLAQRLTPRLCSHCKQPYKADDAVKNMLNISEQTPLTLYKSVGCPICNGTGRSGRAGLYEALWIDKAESSLILSGASEFEIKQSANYISLWDNARQRVLDGVCDLADVEHYYKEYTDE